MEARCYIHLVTTLAKRDVSISEFNDYAHMSSYELANFLKPLIKRSILKRRGDTMTITEKGRIAAKKIREILV